MSIAQPEPLLPSVEGAMATTVLDAVRHSTEAVGRKARLVRQGLATEARQILGLRAA